MSCLWAYMCFCLWLNSQFSVSYKGGEVNFPCELGSNGASIGLLWSPLFGDDNIYLTNLYSISVLLGDYSPQVPGQGCLGNC